MSPSPGESSSAQPAASRPTPLSPSPTEITLALGGGGAKGIAHIGILKAIDATNLRIVSIVGTSIGAIWAALFVNLFSGQLRNQSVQSDAQHTAIAAIERIAYMLKFSDYMDLSIKNLFTKYFVTGDRFEEWLTTQLWSRGQNRALTFRDIDFDLDITATRSETGESLVLNRANTPDLAIAKAARASMSIQGFFKESVLDIPKPDGENQSVRCWDGGTTGNCRFDLALRRDPSRVVVASSLTYRGEPVQVDKGPMRSPWRLSRTRDHSISILMRQIESLLLENSEPSGRLLLLRPPLQEIGTFDLNISNKKKASVIAASQAYSEAAIRAFLDARNAKA